MDKMNNGQETLIARDKVTPIPDNKKTPAFQCYPNDWLADPEIMLMSSEQVGALFLLYLIAWNNEDCSIPNDDRILAKYSRLGRSWKKHSSTLKRFFIEGNGRLTPPKLFLERVKQSQYREKQRANGAKGGRPKGIDNEEVAGESEKGLGFSGETQKKPTGKPKKSSSSSSSISSSSSSSSNNNKSKSHYGEKSPLGFKECVDFWLKNFHKNWEFNAVEGKYLKSLLGKIEKTVLTNGNIISEETILNAFRVLCENLPDWFKDKNVRVINQNYDSIIDQIKNSKNGNSFAKNGARQSADAYR